MSRIKLTSSGSSWRRTAVRLAFNESVPSKPRRKPEAVKGIRRTQLPGHGLGAIAPCRVAAVLVLALSRHFPGQAREGKVDDHAHGPAENRRQAMEVPLFCDGTLRSFRASELANESSLETAPRLENQGGVARRYQPPEDGSTFTRECEFRPFARRHTVRAASTCAGSNGPDPRLRRTRR